MQQTVGGEVAAAERIFDLASAFTADFDGCGLSGADATRLLTLATKTKALMGVVEALALVRIDETNAYKVSGHRSAADYGAAKTGTSRSNAQRSMKTAKQSRRLPNTEEAWRNGDLSPEQAETTPTPPRSIPTRRMTCWPRPSATISGR